LGYPICPSCGATLRLWAASAGSAVADGQTE